MTAWWQRWVQFWSDREHPAPWAMFRIAVGLVVLQTLASVWWCDVTPLYVASSHGGFAPDIAAPWVIQWFGGATSAVVDGILGLGVAGACALIIGFGSRWTPLLLGQVVMVIFAMHPGTGGGHDRLITNALWLLVLTSGTGTWSLDAYLATGSWRREQTISVLGRRMAVFQLVLMYTWTGIQKQGLGWGLRGDYRALYDALLLPTWSRWDMTWIGDVFVFTQIGTVVAWWWETLWIVLGLWLLLRHPLMRSSRLGAWLPARDLRVPFVLIGIVTHGTLWVTMNLGPFTPITFAFYLGLLTGEDYTRWRSRRDAGREEGPALL